MHTSLRAGRRAGPDESTQYVKYEYPAAPTRVVLMTDQNNSHTSDVTELSAHGLRKLPRWNVCVARTNLVAPINDDEDTKDRYSAESVYRRLATRK